MRTHIFCSTCVWQLFSGVNLTPARNRLQMTSKEEKPTASPPSLTASKSASADGVTPVDPMFPFYQAIRDENLDGLKQILAEFKGDPSYLLNAQGDPSKNGSVRTPLFVASETGNIELLTFLIKAGAKFSKLQVPANHTTNKHR
jgi:hypothetical protein